MFDNYRLFLNFQVHQVAADGRRAVHEDEGYVKAR